MWHLLIEDDAYAFARQSPGDQLVVVFNDSTAERELKIPLGDTPMQGITTVRSIYGKGSGSADGEAMIVKLGPQSVGIFAVDSSGK